MGLSDGCKQVGCLRMIGRGRGLGEGRYQGWKGLRGMGVGASFAGDGNSGHQCSSRGLLPMYSSTRETSCFAFRIKPGLHMFLQMGGQTAGGCTAGGAEPIQVRGAFGKRS